MTRSSLFRLGVLTDWPLEASAADAWPEHVYAHVARAAPERALVAFFTPADIRFREKTVHGWTLRPARGGPRWIKERIPFPDAIYNRISRRETERRRAAATLLKRLGERRPLFNPRFIDKWEAHEALSAQTTLQRHLPRTRLYEGPETLLDAARDWDSFYVKPIDGSLGRGIVRIERAKAAYRVARNAPDFRNVAAFDISERELVRRASRWFSPRGAVAQERVDLLEWQPGRSLDLRLLVQRLPRSSWSLTGVAGRAAPRGGVTTHTVRGGERIAFSKAQQRFGRLVPSIDELERLSVASALALQERLGGGFFEFSLDVGVDRRGRAFVLEANAKPFPFDEVHVRRKAAERLIAFARSAADDPRLLRPVDSAFEELEERGVSLA